MPLAPHHIAIVCFSTLVSSLEALEFRVEVGANLQETFDKLSQQLAPGVPEGGVNVKLASGIYHVDRPITLGAHFKGTAERPIRIEAEGEVWIEGSQALDPSSFHPVSDPQERALLAASAVDEVRVSEVKDEYVHRALSHRLMLNLIVGEQTFLPSVFPNQGYATLASEVVTPEVSPPAIAPENVGYGARAGRPPQQEPGRALGWRGSLKEPRGARVGFGADATLMAGTWQQWENEIARDQERNQLTGFIEANWLLSSQVIHAASTKDQCIHLSKALHYGWDWKQNDKPFRVFGLLCELDQPGEWHYDRRTRRLYLYPPEPLTPETSVGVALASGFLDFDGASHVTVRGLSARNFARGNIYHLRGSNNTLTGLTACNSTATGVRIHGEHNTLRDADLYDLSHHVSMSGGKRGPGILEHGRNTVINCHIYQKRVRHQKVNISIAGVGHSFRHNLVHNSIGQAMMIRGNDHLIELNEFFNIGFEEGDGGAMYAGGDLTGYGTTYRYNFFHHLMHHPGKVERSGIHLDDLQAGSICVGNIFYKSAAKGIFMNGGAGHEIRENIFLDGFRGAYNVGHISQQNYERQLTISADPNSPERLTKEDYVGRVERTVGPQGWNEEPWKTHYPVFRQVMNDAGKFGRLWPIRCQIVDNVYCRNEYDESIFSRVAPEAMAKVELRGDRQVSPNDFVDYEGMNFSAQKGSRLPRIPFGKIGLRITRDRLEMPDKVHYRKAVKKFFQGIPSMPGTKKQIDTAAVIESGPMLNLKQSIGLIKSLKK